MGTYFIGIDYGTVHTKVCVREDIADRPSIVPVRDHGTALERHLLTSIPEGWKAPTSPKVLLCGSSEMDPELEHRTIGAAAAVVAAGLRAAIAHVADVDPGKHRYFLNLGLPTEAGVMVDVAKLRYYLVAKEAIDMVDRAGIQLSTNLLDERLASLALLDRAKKEFRDEPLFVVDGGGWTTHASLIRWITAAGDTSVSIHGDCTAIHGVHALVQALERQLALSDRQCVDVLSRVLESSYAVESDREQLDVDAAIVRTREIAAAYVHSAGCSAEVASRHVTLALQAFRGFARDRVLHDAWNMAWRAGYQASPGSRHYGSFRLVLAGGACRIGRSPATRVGDPLSVELAKWQRSTGIPFTAVLYPETDPRFWAFSPEPDPEVVPYFFVAGGYAFPLSDWPKALKRQVTMWEPRRLPVRCICTGMSDSCPMCLGSGYRFSTSEIQETANGATPFPAGAGRQIKAAETDHLCSICSERSPSYGALSHWIQHACSVCDQYVADKRAHLRSVHGFTDCPVCGLLVGNQKRHHRSAHEPRAPRRVRTPSVSAGPSRTIVAAAGPSGSTGQASSQTAPGVSRRSPRGLRVTREYRPLPRSTPAPTPAPREQRKSSPLLGARTPKETPRSGPQALVVTPPFRSATVVGYIPPDVLRGRMGTSSRKATGMPKAAHDPKSARRADSRDIMRESRAPAKPLTHRPFATFIIRKKGS